MNSIKKSSVLGVLGVVAGLAVFATFALSSGKMAQACDNNKSSAKTASVTQTESTANAKVKTAQTTEVLTCPVTGVSVKVVSGCGFGKTATKTAEMHGEQMQVHTAEMVSGSSCSAAAKAAVKTAALRQACEKTPSSATATTVAAQEISCSTNQNAKMVEEVSTGQESQENTAQVITD